MKLNRKGFTLIELLSTIVIISLVSGITITVALGTITNAKNKSKQLTIRNIETQAEKYIYEGFSNNTWYPSSDNTEYQCVTIKQLIEAGYFKAEILTENADILKENYTVKVTRNALNKAVVSRNLEDENITNVCTKITSNNSVITCEYDKEWLTEKTVKIKYDNNKNTNVINGMYLNGIAFDASKIEYGQQDPENVFHYTTNKSEMTVVVQSEGSIYANAMSSGTQIGSLVCIVNGIDNQGPTITVENARPSIKWINQKGEAIFNVSVLDDHVLDKDANINSIIGNIHVFVKDNNDSIEVTEASKKIELLNSTENEAIYKLIISNVTGNGQLSITFDESTFKDKAGNGNEGVTFDYEVTGIQVDNIVPKLNTVTDSKGNTCYDVNCETGHDDEENHPNKNGCWKCSSWKNDLNYTVTSTIKQDDGSPISQVGWFGKYSMLATMEDMYYALLSRETFPMATTKTLLDLYNGYKYLYLSDEAGNYNKYGYGPYIINIDTQVPNIILTVDKNNLTCKISDDESGIAAYKICNNINGDKDNCNSINYTQINPTEKSKTITKNNVANGTWSCYAEDAAGNSDQKSAVVNYQAQPYNMNVSFVGKIGSQNYNGGWTNQNVKLIGTITTNATDVKYLINTSPTANGSTTGWHDYSSSTSIEQEEKSSQNTTHYLHVKYKEKDTSTSYTYIDKSLNVKIDKNPPTCQVTISNNNNANGIKVTKSCSDTGGSGCTKASETYTNVKTTQTYQVSDKAGNTSTNQCQVTVKLQGRKQYCNTYYEACKNDVTYFYNTRFDYPLTSIGIVECYNPLPTPDNFIPQKIAYYDVIMPLDHIRAGYKRCNYKNYNGQKPVELAVKSAFICLNYKPIEPDLNRLKLSHIKYNCKKYNSSFDASTTCSTESGVLQTPSSGNWYKCTYVYYGTTS